MIEKIIYEDTQFLLVEEISNTYTKEKTPRKLPLRVFGKHVGKYEVGDKIKILGFYSVDVEDETDHKKIQMKDSYNYYLECTDIEKLDDDKEVELSKSDLDMFQ